MVLALTSQIFFQQITLMVPCGSGNVTGFQFRVRLPQQFRDIQRFRTTRQAITAPGALIALDPKNPGATSTNFLVSAPGKISHGKSSVHLAPVEQSRDVDILWTWQALIANCAKLIAETVSVLTLNLGQYLFEYFARLTGAVVVLGDQIGVDLFRVCRAERECMHMWIIE